MVKIAKEEQGYPILWTIFDVVDDTKLVSKIILQELMANFDELINDAQGKKVLMYLVAPRNTKYLQYELIQLMKTSDTLGTRYDSLRFDFDEQWVLFFWLAKINILFLNKEKPTSF